MGWEKWVGSKGEIVGIDHFGASAPYQTILERYGFTTDAIITKAKELINRE
jgi:transketolase